MLHGEMPIPLRVLLIEDYEDDALRIVLELQRGGYEPTWQRLDTSASLATALAREKWQLIICDSATCGLSTQPCYG
jgi:two-component system sensor histidine kinase UhpB